MQNGGISTVLRRTYSESKKSSGSIRIKNESELAMLSDEEVAQSINDSGCFIFQCGDDVALLPKKYAELLVWIRR